MTVIYSSHGRMVVHRVCTSHFPYPPLGWWSFRLLPYLGYWSNVAASVAMRMSFDTPMSHPWAVHLWVQWMPLMVVFYFSRNVYTAFYDGFTNSAVVCKLSLSIFAVGSWLLSFWWLSSLLRWHDTLPQFCFAFPGWLAVLSIFHLPAGHLCVSFSWYLFWSFAHCLIGLFAF